MFLPACVCTTFVPGAQGSQRDYQTSWNSRQSKEWPHHMVLQSEPRSSARAECALNYGALSLAPRYVLKVAKWS